VLDVHSAQRDAPNRRGVRTSTPESVRSRGVETRAATSGRAALADAAGLTRGAMTTALDRIEARGYARRVWDQQDRRTVRVEMTEAGKKLVEGSVRPTREGGLSAPAKVLAPGARGRDQLPRGWPATPARTRAEDSRRRRHRLASCAANAQCRRRKWEALSSLSELACASDKVVAFTHEVASHAEARRF
jgi:DNA-binding PadR family transcriptional regulator